MAVEPLHRPVDGRLDPLVRVRELHQQLDDRHALRRTEGRKLERSGAGRLQSHRVILLAPYRRLALDHDLGSEDALYALVERSLELVLDLIVHQPGRVWRIVVDYVVEEVERARHRIVVVGDVDLIADHARPELRPAAVFVLSAEEVFYALVETLAVARVAGGVPQAGEVCHLGGRGAVVSGGIVGPGLVRHHLREFLVRQAA